jgi:hypothetical protein
MRTFADIVSTLKLETASAEEIHLTYEMAGSSEIYPNVSIKDKFLLLRLMISYAFEENPVIKRITSREFDSLLAEKFK